MENSCKEKYPYCLITEHVIDCYGVEADTPYEILTVNARELLCSARIDLMAKWLYIEASENNLTLGPYEQIYSDHIGAFSNYTYTEPGNPEKNSVEKYLHDFKMLIDSIRNGGFDDKVSLIPVGQDYQLLDGSHRVAVAAYYNKTVTVIRFLGVYQRFDYNFFLNRGLNRRHLDRMVEKYVEIASDIHIFLLWPAASDEAKISESLKLIHNSFDVVYEKSIYLTWNGMCNFVRQVYSGESWIGTIYDNYAGSAYKANQCYSDRGFLNVIVVQSNDEVKLTEVKNRIRGIFDIENHSVHSTDSKEEAVSLAHLLFNRNSIHFMNNGYPEKYVKTSEWAELFRNVLKQYNRDISQYAIDSSAVMSLYGLREARDLDYLTLDDEITINDESHTIDNHASQLKYYGKTRQDLILNPDNYFMYFGMKYISLDRIYEAKDRRGEVKDIKDLILMVQNSLVDNCVTTLGRISIHMAEHCNLNCRSCDNFSPLADEEYLSRDELWRELERLVSLKIDVKEFLLTGGEPLLSPYLAENMLTVNAFYPNSAITIITNGMLLDKMSDDFWDAVRRTGTKISFTVYPINMDYERLFALCSYKGINYDAFNDLNTVKTSYYMPFDISGGADVNDNLSKCYHFGHCVQLYHGRLYGCSIAANVRHFNQYFDKHLPEDNYIDIYQSDVDQIMDFLVSPYPLCSYCRVDKRTYNNSWGLSERLISEWTLSKNKF